jgi:hypothetical protein
MLPTTTSTNIEYNVSKLDVISNAFATINIFGPDESIPARDYNYASFMLNIMIKSWMGLNYNLWLKKICYLFPRLSQTDYSMSATSTDNYTLAYHQTTLSIDEAALVTSIHVIDASNIALNDYLGIIMSNHDFYWTTVANKVGNQVFFAAGAALPYLAYSGSRVVNYTTKMSNPLNVYQATRSIDWLIDVEMNYLSFQEYMALPNKQSSPSTPVSYNYDRQLENTIIRLWPQPGTADLLVKLVVSQKIANEDVNSDEPYFPEEWFDAIVLHLAVKLSPRYGKHKDAGFSNLIQMADRALNLALAFDNEVGSIYFSPNNIN